MIGCELGFISCHQYFTSEITTFEHLIRMGWDPCSLRHASERRKRMQPKFLKTSWLLLRVARKAEAREESQEDLFAAMWLTVKRGVQFFRFQHPIVMLYRSRYLFPFAVFDLRELIAGASQ